MPASKRQTSLALTLTGSREKLRLISLDAHEALSEPFMISLDVLARSEIELLPNLGRAASVECLLDGEHLRYFHGVVIDARFSEELAGEGFVYSLTLAPLAHFHAQRKCAQFAVSRLHGGQLAFPCGQKFVIRHRFPHRSGTKAEQVAQAERRQASALRLLLVGRPLSAVVRPLAALHRAGS